jgi:EmrB/QacA subfamily drug resistance transporter
MAASGSPADGGVETPTPPWSAIQKMTVLATGLGVFMIFLDALIVNVALPDIQAHFGVGEAGLQWVVAGYSLGMAVLMMASATMADRMGRRRLYVVGVLVFGVGSVAAGLTGGLGMMVAARCVQGMAAAALSVASLALVSAAFPNARQRLHAIGVWTAVGIVGLALGPTIGGALTELVTWRAVFLVNAPVVVLAVLLTLRYVEESADRRAGDLDLPGQLLFAVTVGAFAYAVIDGQDLGWLSPWILGLLAVTAVGLVAFAVRELRTAAPLMDVRLFSGRLYRLAIITVFTCLFCGYGMLLVVTQYFQNVRGFSPMVAGLLVLPFSVVQVVLSPRTGRIAARIGSRKPVLLGQVLLVGGMLAILVGMSFSLVVVCTGIAVTGTGICLIMTPATGVAMSSVPQERSGMASGILSTQRALGSTAGYAILGAVLATWLGATLDEDLDAALPESSERTAVVERIIDEANPHAYASAIGPGRPIARSDPKQEEAIRDAADGDFVQGIQLGLGLAVMLTIGVLVAQVRGFHDQVEPSARAPARQPSG